MSFAFSARAAFAAARLSVAVLVSLGALFGSVSARADTLCTQDSDCAKGFTCQTVQGGCSLTPPATACEPGVECDAAAAAPPDCTGTGERLCEPGPCTTDADCASGMACHATSTESCGTPGCADPSQGCSTAVTCTTVNGPSMCVPKYELPCTVDADCGDHFTCTPNMGGVCEGSVSGDGAAPTIVCTTTPTGTSSCVPNTIDCKVDGDCPATWTCSGSSGGALGDCASGGESVDGAVTTTPCTPNPAPTPTYCIPPSYGGSFASSSHGSSDGSGASGSNQGAAPTSGQSSPTTPQSTGTEGGASGGGCGVGGSPGGGAIWLCAAAMALGLARRRRANAPVALRRR